MAETINNNLFLQQNQLFVAGDLHVHTDEQKTQTKTENSEDILENRIFSKLFDTNQKLLRLRQEIANSIDLGEFTPLYQLSPPPFDNLKKKKKKKGMNAIDNFLKVFDKLPKEQQQKAIPLLKRISTIIENNNEIIKRKYEFNANFTAVVGVVFGVLAVFNNLGENQFADIVYIIGLTCCGLCLLFCVIGLYQPVHNESVRKNNNILKAFEDLTKVFASDQDQVKREIEDTEMEQIEERKPTKAFKWLYIFSYILFGISVVCMMAKVIIVYTITY